MKNFRFWKGSFQLKGDSKQSQDIKGTTKEEMEYQQIPVPLWKGVFYMLMEGLLFILLLAYFLLKNEIGFKVPFLVLILIFGGLIILHSKNKKIKIRFRKGSSILSTTKEIKTEARPLLTLNKIGTVWAKHKKKLLVVSGAILIIIGAFSVRGNYSQSKRDELDCLQRVEYRGGTIYRIKDEYRNFKTQTEAMNYCLKVLK